MAFERLGDHIVCHWTENGDTHDATVPLPPTAFQTGKNTLAVEVHQSTPSIGDASFDAELSLTQSTDGPPGVAIDRNTWVRARTRNSAGTVWSALDEALFLVDAPAVSPGDVVISELNFNPPGIAQEEFIELQNVSSRAVNLRGCRFMDGIDYAFSDVQDVFMAPGQRLVIVADYLGFQAKYGLDIPVTGRFFGSLDNGGEKLTLVKPDGTGLLLLTYDDATPWPTGTDGGGNTLVRRDGADPASNAASWRASAVAGGTPGGKDTLPFNGNPDTDADGDGLSAWAEYAFGTSDSDSSAGNTLHATTTAAASGTLNLTYQRALAAEAVRYVIETSGNLTDWAPPAAAPVLVSQVQNSSGTIQETWTIMGLPSVKTFVRLRLAKQ